MPADLRVHVEGVELLTRTFDAAAEGFRRFEAAAALAFNRGLSSEFGWYIGGSKRLYGKRAMLRPSKHRGMVHAIFDETNDSAWDEWSPEEGDFFRCNFVIQPRDEWWNFPERIPGRVLTQAPDFDLEREEYPEIRTDWMEIADQGVVHEEPTMLEIIDRMHRLMFEAFGVPTANDYDDRRYVETVSYGTIKPQNSGKTERPFYFGRSPVGGVRFIA